MNIRLKLLTLTIMLLTQAIAEESPPRLEILHPKPDMQFWVDRIEVAGNIPSGTEVEVSGTKVVPDDEGLFRYFLDLKHPEVYIPIRETRGDQTFLDTIRIFHRNLDHMSRIVCSSTITFQINYPWICSILVVENFTALK